MNRRSSLLVVGFLVAALIGVALLAVPGSPIRQEPTLGLDLQGGLEVTLQAVPPPNRDLTEEDLDRSVEIMRSRVDRLGVTEPEIRTQGDDQIVIQLPGISDPEAAAEIIGKTAQLELYDLETSLTGPSISIQGQPVEFASLYDLLVRVQAQATQGTPDAYYVFNPRRSASSTGPFDEKEALKRFKGEAPGGSRASRRARGNGRRHVRRRRRRVPRSAGSRRRPGSDVLLPLQVRPAGHPPDDGRGSQALGHARGLRYEPRAAPVADRDHGVHGSRLRQVRADHAGRVDPRKAAAGAAALRDRPRPRDPDVPADRLHRLEPRPAVSAAGGPRSRVSSRSTRRRDIAIVLQTGALPVNFETLDRTDISATLGKDSLDEAKRAAIGGLLLVAIFLLIFYRFLGLVAVAGLVIYAAFLYATILLFNVTLTLPGFAGLVLTFGVAADANIVIFERIKEEVRAGRSVRAAISQGYKKGFATIVDANVVTAITAMVLFAVATASVRGFALMLLIGTALSMLTAVLATRAILALFGGFGWLENPKVMGATGQGIPRWMRLDYIGMRRIWFAFSGLVVAISIGAIAVKRPQSRHRLRGRNADHVPNSAGDRTRDGAPGGGWYRSSRRGDPGSRHVGRRQVHGASRSGLSR